MTDTGTNRVCATAADWFKDWKTDLDSASAALVVFSDKYRDKFKSEATPALRDEAKALLRRIDASPEFLLFVCDARSADQGPAVIRAWLQDGAGSKNVKRWREFVETSLGLAVGPSRPLAPWDGPSSEADEQDEDEAVAEASWVTARESRSSRGDADEADD